MPALPRGAAWAEERLLKVPSSFLSPRTAASKLHMKDFKGVPEENFESGNFPGKFRS